MPLRWLILAPSENARPGYVRFGEVCRQAVHDLQLSESTPTKSALTHPFPHSNGASLARLSLLLLGRVPRAFAANILRRGPSRMRSILVVRYMSLGAGIDLLLWRRSELRSINLQTNGANIAGHRSNQ
jgi:hypothetical protein